MFFNVLSALAIHIGLSGCGFIVFLVAGNVSQLWLQYLLIALGTLVVLLLYFVTGITFEKGEKQWQKEVSAWILSALLLTLCVLAQIFDWTFLNSGLFLNAPFLPLWGIFNKLGLSIATSSLLLSVLPSIFIWAGVKSQKTAVYRWFKR